MDIVPLGPGFAAELRGVTLDDIAADDTAYAAARAAFEQHSVLVFRGQAVTDEGQLAFSRRFGPPEVTKVGSLGNGTHFITLTTIGPDGKVVPPDHRTWWMSSERTGIIGSVADVVDAKSLGEVRSYKQQMKAAKKAASKPAAPKPAAAPAPAPAGWKQNLPERGSPER